MGYFQTLAMCLLAASQSSAHFLLNYPPTIGFDDDLEATAPCGSFTPDFPTDNVTNFGVGGSAIALTSIHPQATWLFRATLDKTASGNWTSLLPSIQQTGLGAYCEQDVTVPADWAGSQGIIGVVQDAPDGILYQCATVNFVAGKISPPSDCTNVTGLSASYVADAVLSTLPASGTTTSTASGTAISAGATTTGSSTTAASSTATTKASAANKVPTFEIIGLFTWAVMAVCGGLGAFSL